MNAIKKKIEGFTEKQVKPEQESSRLYHQLGFPTMENMNLIIRHNLIKNCPVTTEDINLSNRMFSPDISMLKVQYKFPKTFQVMYDYIEIPKKTD